MPLEGSFAVECLTVQLFHDATISAATYISQLQLDSDINKMCEGAYGGACLDW